MPTGSINILFGKTVREAILVNLIKKEHETSVTKGQSTERRTDRLRSAESQKVARRCPGLEARHP